MLVFHLRERCLTNPTSHWMPLLCPACFKPFSTTPWDGFWKHLWSEGSSAVGRRGLASSIALWTLQAAPQECRVTLKQGAGCSWAAVPLKIRSPSRDCKWAWAEQLQVIHDGPHWAKTWTQWVAWAVRPQPLSYVLRTGLFPSEKKHRLAYDLSNLNRRNSTSFLHVLQQQ